MPWKPPTRDAMSGRAGARGAAAMRTLYDVLGVRGNADPETIKQAFRRAVKAHHPDVSGGDAVGGERFRDIIAANEILRDPEQRATYDRQLALERELSQSARRDALVRAALVAIVVALVVVGGSEVWIAVTRPPAGEKRWTHSDANVVMASRPDESMAASVSSDAQPAAGLRSEPDPMPLPTTREAADDSAGRDPAIDSSMLSDSFAALPPAPPASSLPDRATDTSSQSAVDPDIADLDEAVRLAPDDAGAYRRRGNLWGRKGDMDRALADYDEAIRLDPNDIAIFHDRGVMWQRNGELDKALVDLDRAVRMSFADPEVYSDRGAVWLEKGRYDRALADFNQALKIAPGLTSASVRRAMALDRKGDQDRARAKLEQATHLDRPSPVDRTDSAPDSFGER